MTNVEIKLKDGDEPVSIVDARDVTLDFRKGTIIVNFNDEAGPQTGSYAFSDIEDIDWNVQEGTAETETPLTTYQQRAIRNLPPKIAGQPDLTMEPVLPRVASPTPIPQVTQEKAGVGTEAKVPNYGMASLTK